MFPFPGVLLLRMRNMHTATEKLTFCLDGVKTLHSYQQADYNYLFLDYIHFGTLLMTAEYPAHKGFFHSNYLTILPTKTQKTR